MRIRNHNVKFDIDVGLNNRIGKSKRMKIYVITTLNPVSPTLISQYSSTSSSLSSYASGNTSCETSKNGSSGNKLEGTTKHVSNYTLNNSPVSQTLIPGLKCAYTSRQEAIDKCLKLARQDWLEANLAEMEKIDNEIQDLDAKISTYSQEQKQHKLQADNTGICPSHKKLSTVNDWNLVCAILERSNLLSELNKVVDTPTIIYPPSMTISVSTHKTQTPQLSNRVTKSWIPLSPSPHDVVDPLIPTSVFVPTLNYDTNSNTNSKYSTNVSNIPASTSQSDLHHTNDELIMHVIGTHNISYFVSRISLHIC